VLEQAAAALRAQAAEAGTADRPPSLG